MKSCRQQHGLYAIFKTEADCKFVYMFIGFPLLQTIIGFTSICLLWAKVMLGVMVTFVGRLNGKYSPIIQIANCLTALTFSVTSCS